MAKNIKKHIFEIALAVLAVWFIGLAMLGILTTDRVPSKHFFFGGYSVDKAWTANVYELTDLGSSDDDRVYDSVWISFASIDYTEGVEEVVIRASRSTSKTSSFSMNNNTKVVFKNNADSLNVGGWVKLYDYDDGISTTPYFIIATRNQIKVNEVVFIGEEDGELSIISATGIGSGFVGTTETSWSKKFSESEVGKTEKDIKSANRLVDEQSTFDPSLIDGDSYNGGRKFLLDSELSILSTIDAFSDGRGTVDQTANPLGVYIIALGRIVFGGNAFGLRIMPLLFSVGCMLMLYAIGLKLFREKSYAFILSLIYFISGYSLAYATVASVSTIMTFFVLLAFYNALSFSRADLDKNDRKTFLSVLFSGLALSCAIAVKSQAIYFIPVVLAPIIYALIKAFKNKNSREACGFGIAVSLISFILLPVFIIIGAYGIGANIYMTENATSVFDYGFKHFVVGLNNGYGSSIGYIINLGVEYFGDGKIAIANFMITYMAIVSTLYLLYVVITLLVKADKTKKYLLPKTFLFLCLGYIGSYLLSLLFAGNPSVYALSSVFGMILTVTAFRHLDKVYKKPLFAMGNMQVTAVRIAGVVMFIASIVAFAIGLPILLGI